MTKDIEQPERLGHAVLIRRLIEETGITRDQAQELIMRLGAEWPSLVREAHLLRKKS